jgi:hypothetical protein
LHADVPLIFSDKLKKPNHLGDESVPVLFSAVNFITRRWCNIQCKIVAHVPRIFGFDGDKLAINWTRSIHLNRCMRGFLELSAQCVVSQNLKHISLFLLWVHVCRRDALLHNEARGRSRIMKFISKDDFNFFFLFNMIGLNEKIIIIINTKVISN